MKIWINKANENWVVDVFRDEVMKYRPDIYTDNISEADIVWLIADWCFNQIDLSKLKGKKVVMTCHHFTPWKIDEAVRRDFEERKKIVDVFHVPCTNTKKQLINYFNVPEDRIVVQSFWVDDNIWFSLNTQESRELVGIDENKFVISSFQRDTEGVSGGPKLEKGPDVFCEYVERFVKINPDKDVLVLLGAWRRSYIQQRLAHKGIDFLYKELPSQEMLNCMYNATDLYVVGSRVEGHPMSILECAVTGTPCISTTMGIAQLILPFESLATVYHQFYTTPDLENGKLAAQSLLGCRPNTMEASLNVQKYTIKNGGLTAVIDQIA